MFEYVKLMLLLGGIFVISGCIPRVGRVLRSRADEKYNLPIKGIKQTTREEALLCKEYYKQKRDFDLTAKYLEHALTLVQDHSQRGELLLELADCYMELEEREKAARLYGQYKALYPGSVSIKYVLFQELLAQNYEMLSSTKDQSKTKETLKLAQEFLKEFPEDTTHHSQIREIMQKCYLTLLASEIEASNFYLNKYRYTSDVGVLKAAQARIEYALKEYMPHLEGMEQFLTIGKEIDTSSPEVYYKSLEHVIAYVLQYVRAHLEPEPNFIARFFSPKHGDTSEAP